MNTPATVGIDSKFGLHGKNALVTGGGTGLGRHFARELASAGARVILCARRLDKIRGCADEINGAGGSAECYPMDVTDVESVRSALGEANQGGLVTVVVNNAGVNYGESLVKVSEEDWDSILDTNLKGAWIVAREAVKLMAEEGVGGSVINIASILGQAVQQGAGPYSASKAGLIHLTKSMALEWAKLGVRVNALAPGYFATDIVDDFLASDVGQKMLKQVPQRRFGDFSDLSGPILLLASDASAYMTGTTITIDGGHSIPTTL